MTATKRNARNKVFYARKTDGDIFTMISYSLNYFQIIEQLLRQYLKSVSEIISERSKDIPFKLQFYKETDSLGKLVEAFEKLNNNKQLIKELRKIAHDRNIVAHKVWHNFWGDVSETVIKSKGQDNNIINQAINEMTGKHVSKLKKVCNNAAKCLFSLTTEYVRIHKIEEQS